VTLWTAEAVEDAVRREVGTAPRRPCGRDVRFVPVTFVNGHRRERSMIRGYAARPELYRVIDVDRRETLLDGRGLVLTDRLADKLGLRAAMR
jgi:putative ABC transport system permease protein